jgi:hypothetical protein
MTGKIISKLPAEQWRDYVKIHTAADRFPMMSDGELKSLSDDIERNGLMGPLAFFTAADRASIGAGAGPGENLMEWAQRKKFNLLLLDGRNRLAAIDLITNLRTRAERFEEAFDPRGIHAPLLLSAINRVDVEAYVVSLNLHRRHLDIEARRKIAAELLKAQPGQSDRSVSKIAHLDNKTAASVRAELERREEIPHVEVRTDAKGRRQPATTTKKRDRRAPSSAGKPPAAARDQAIIAFSATLHSKLAATLEDLVKLLADERGQITALPHAKRVALARGYMNALGIGLEDLRGET